MVSYDIDQVTVRAVLDPGAASLRSVAQLSLRLLPGAPTDIEFFVNSGRTVVRVLGPRGEELACRTSTYRTWLHAFAFRKLTVTIPEHLRHEAPLVLTFFLDGTVRDGGFMGMGCRLDESGLITTADALFPMASVPLVENSRDPYHYIELEIMAPPGWTLVTGGEPEVGPLSADSQETVFAGLDDERARSFMGRPSTGSAVRWHWPRIGVSNGLMYLYGGPDWLIRTREVCGIPIRMCATPPDTAVAWPMLDEAAKAMPVLIEEIGPFPFRSLCIALPPQMILGDQSAGMDSWGMITLQPKCPASDRSCVGTLIHEMVHQYWNQCMSTPEDGTATLSEPFTSYLGLMLTGKIFGDPDSFRGQRYNACWDYWRSAQLYHEPPLRDQVEMDPFLMTSYYAKGCMVAAMLADLVGDDEFRNFQHDVFAAGEGMTFSLDSLMTRFEVMRPGYGGNLVRDLFTTVPRYDYAIRGVAISGTGADSCLVDVRVQRNLGGPYPMLLKTSFSDSTAVYTRIAPDLRDQTIRVQGPVPFRRAELDPDVRTIDADRHNNVYPRRQVLGAAWARTPNKGFPQPDARFGQMRHFSARSFVVCPVLDYTDPDGMRYGLGLEMNRAYQDRFSGWAAWSRDQERLRSHLEWITTTRPMGMFKFGAEYGDDGLVREALLTAYLPSWRNRVALSVGVGYEQRPDAVTGVAKLGYDKGAAALRLGVSFPLLDYYWGMLNNSSWWSYLLRLEMRAAGAGGTTPFEYAQLEGDTRLGLGPLGLRFRWGLSDRVTDEGEGYALGGRWAYAEDGVRLVRGYDLQFVRRFVLLNLEASCFAYRSANLVAVCDLSRAHAVDEGDARTQVGYGIGVRYLLPRVGLINRTVLRIDYAAPREGIDLGRLYVGAGSGF
jgi:hypothetical protein